MILELLIAALVLACLWLLWRQQRLRKALHDMRAAAQTASEGAEGEGPEGARLAVLLRESIEWLNEGFALFDPDDQLVLSNERYRQLHGLADSQLRPGVRFEDIVRTGLARGHYPQAIGREETWFAERLEQHRRGGPPLEQQRADGRWLLIFEQRTRDGHIVSIFADITELKQREAELVLAERGLSEVLESLEEGFALLDEQDRLILWNKKYEEMFPAIADLIYYGVTVEELMRAAADRGQVPDAQYDKEAWVQDRLRAYRELESNLEVQLSNKRWVMTRKYRGIHGRTLALFLDITEQKQREAELREAKLQAETANRIKSEFLANMSHELRTPLNAIIGFSDILIKEQAGPIGTPLYREYAKDVNDSGHQLLRIIEDLIDLSRLETGQVDLRESEVRLAELLARSRRAFEDKAAHAGVSLDVEPSEQEIEIWADELRLRQVLHNLLSNAIKFTPSGGSVRLEAGLSAEGEITIAVSDTGIGMTRHEIDIALEPFRQAEPSLTRAQGGSGIGLTLCNALVQLHGGTLKIEGAKGRGITVTLRLPAERRLIRQTAAPRAAS